MSRADALESYLVPATEAMGKNPFGRVIYLDNKIQFINPTMKIKGNLYTFDKPTTIRIIMKTIIDDNWSEKDFLQAIENNIVYDDRMDKYYYDDNVNQGTPGDYKVIVESRKEDWDKLQCIPFFYEEYNGNRIFYSKAKHMFIYCADRSYLQDNLNNRTITWGRALKEFKAEFYSPQQLQKNKKFAEQFIKKAGLSDILKVFIDKKKNALGLIMYKIDYDVLGNRYLKLRELLSILKYEFGNEAVWLEDDTYKYWGFYSSFSK